MTIQGQDAIVSFKKNDWLPFVCATDMSITMNAEELPVRTERSGIWKKVTYQSLSFSMTLSGLLKFDEENWTGWDFMDNWLGFNHVLCRITFNDEAGNQRSIQGEFMVKTNTLGISPGALVKDDFELVGNGELKIFDGTIPCDSNITSITPAGLTDPDGNMSFTYGYSGDPYQIKYRIDGTGPFFKVNAGDTIYYTDVTTGDHFIEMTPICLNGYESDNTTIQAFTMTRGLVCLSTITDITITTSTATPVVGVAGAPSYQYRIDGGSWFTKNLLPTVQSVSLTGLSTGTHTIEMRPLCSNGVNGTGFTKSFSYTSPTTSTVTWTFGAAGTGTEYLKITVNGILVVNQITSNTGTITPNIGDSVKATLYSNAHIPAVVSMELRTRDTTTSTTLDDQTGTSINIFTYTFTANGDSFTINGTNIP